jgi:hypothetical protein
MVTTATKKTTKKNPSTTKEYDLRQEEAVDLGSKDPSPLSPALSQVQLQPAPQPAHFAYSPHWSAHKRCAPSSLWPLAPAPLCQPSPLLLLPPSAEKYRITLGTAAHTYNPSYSGGGDWADHGLRPAKVKKN